MAFILAHLSISLWVCVFVCTRIRLCYYAMWKEFPVLFVEFPIFALLGFCKDSVRNDQANITVFNPSIFSFDVCMRERGRERKREGERVKLNEQCTSCFSLLLLIFVFLSLSIHRILYCFCFSLHLFLFHRMKINLWQPLNWTNRTRGDTWALHTI